MTIELLVSPPAAGKTEACFQRIQQVKRETPFARIWVLVPDRQKAAYFQNNLTNSGELGGVIGVTIGTFRDLYNEILEQNNQFIPVITQALEHRLIQEIVTELFEEKRLQHFQKIKDKPGFLTALKDAFAELRSALIRPEQFVKYSKNSNPVHHELAELYDRYLLRLTKINWIDQEGQSWLAIEELIKKPLDADSISLIVVDGFTSFTGARLSFLKLLGQQVREVVITLPGKIDSKRAVHHRALTVINTICAELSPNIQSLSDDSRLPAIISQIEKHFLETGEIKKIETNTPFMIEVSSQSDEAREALRWIKELHIKNNVSLYECAIFVGNLDIYKPYIRSAAKEFGMNVHFSQQDPLLESPALLAVLSFLQIANDNFPTRSLINLLHSPYFNFHMSENEIEDLEKVSQQGIIVSGKDQWTETWAVLQRPADKLFLQLDDERQHKDLLIGIDLHSLSITFEDKFWAFYSEINQEQSLSKWIEWLEDKLEKLCFYELVESDRDMEAINSLGDVFKAMVISDIEIGIKKINYEQFISDLQGSLNCAGVKESRESRKNAILVSRLIEARGSRYQSVAILGLSEGIFPIIENPDPFLDEKLRKDLGLEPRLQREQVSIFYQAITRSNEHILITRPYLAEGGEFWEASPYWVSVQNLFTDKAIRKVQPGMTGSQENAASENELLFWAILQGELIKTSDPYLNQRWFLLQRARLILDARRSKKASGKFEGNIKGLKSVLAARYSDQYVWNASRLEEYGNCPFKYFTNSALNLNEKITPEAGLNAAQIGSIFHLVLELLYNESKLTHLSPLELINEIVQKVFKSAPDKFGFRISPLWKVEQEQYLETLKQTLQELEGESNEWKIIETEKKFGINGNPHLEIIIDDEKIRLHGVIDRIDKNSKGELRVIDYKTGGSHLEVSDLDNGIRLQLPIYAMAVDETMQLGKIIDGFYWKINEAKASSFTLSSFSANDMNGPEAAYSVVKKHIKNVIRGIRSGEFSPKIPKGGCPDYCPAILWCWRYSAGY